MDINFKKERVTKLLEDMQPYIITQSVPITKWLMKKGTFFTPAEVDASDIPWVEFDSNVDTWPGPDEHYWFRAVITVGDSFSDKPFWLSISTQLSFWDAVNPQFLMFVDNNIVQGVDTNHREVKIFDKAVAGTTFTLDLQGYTGRDNDHYKGCTDKLQLFGQMIEIDEKIQDTYFNILIPNQIVGRLKEGDFSREKLQTALENAVNLLDFRVPHSKCFYESLDECNAYINKAIYEDLAGKDDVIATCIGHTHIDIAWWWTVEQTREKAARSFATALKLMDEYDDFKFMSSQPILYKFVKERYPELYERIKDRIKEGRWEAEGGMWVEADCNVTSGESLVRQFLHGKKFFKEEFGIENKILWLPDVFGYSAAMPQILKKCGIEYFMTTKIGWNQYNKLPVDTFWWKGIDGTKMFTHLITTQDAGNPEDSFYTTYNGMLSPVSVMRAWERYQHKDINNDVLLSCGFGDGGGGTTRPMIEAAKRLDKGIIGAPKVRFETARNYFDSIYDKTANNEKLPSWVGELYLEYHRGTYTSMARNKRSNRKCELLWQDVEFFSVWANMLGKEYNREEIYSSWENILLNQFHDILPGSSIKEVYEVTKEEYTHLEKRAKEIINENLDIISDNTNAQADDVIVFNSLSFNRDDSVIVNCDKVSEFDLTDEDGNKYVTQKTFDNKTIFNAVNIPSKGYKVYKKEKKAKDIASPFTITDKSISTPFFDIDFNDAYNFTKLFDKCAKRDVLKDNELGNVLRVYEDKPIYYDNWDIEIYYKHKSWAVDEIISAKWVEKGPIRATLSVERKFLDSVIKQNIYFYANSRRIDFDTYCDWKQFNLLLKVEFPVEINTNAATYDIQFGNVSRPTHNNTTWDKARFEVCAHKWADLSEGDYGVSILNDCKYGHGITEGKITLTLIKSGILPNPTTDQEEHFFTYSLYPHIGDYKDSNVVAQGYKLNIPCYAVRASGKNESKTTSSLLAIDAKNVIIETVKMAENDNNTVIRMFEAENKRAAAKINVGFDVCSVYECDMLENKIASIDVTNNSFEFVIKPFEIKTFLIERK